MGIPKLLVFGYGNPSRGDDGLGPALVERLDANPDVECLTDFQLQIEHALDLRGRELVLFVDAGLSAPAPFAFERLSPARDDSYTSHAMTPASLLQTYRDVFGEEPPPSFLLSIRGDEFELGRDLSAAAEDHLRRAARFAEALCRQISAIEWDAQTIAA